MKKGGQWEWVFNTEIDIIGLFIKCATFYQDHLCIFAKGHIPRETSGMVSTFILTMKVEKKNGVVVGLDPHYKFIKIHPYMNPQFLVEPTVRNSPDGKSLRFTFLNDIAEAGTWEYIPMVSMIDVPLDKFGSEDVDLLEMEKKLGPNDHGRLKLVDLELDKEYY